MSRFRQLIANGATVFKAQEIARNLLTQASFIENRPDISEMINTFLKPEFLNAFGTTFDDVDNSMHVESLIPPDSYIYAENRVRSSMFLTFRFAVMVQNLDLIELGLAQGLPVDSLWWLALANGNVDLAMRLHKLATYGKYEEWHSLFEAEEPNLITNEETLKTLLDFEEVRGEPMEWRCNMAAVQLPYDCSPAAMRLALCYGSEERQAIVRRELYFAVSNGMLTTKLYKDPAVYSVLVEAGMRQCLGILMSGVNLNACDEQGRTCLHVTQSATHAQHLLDIGANPNVADNCGRTALVTATLAVNLCVMRVLLDTGHPSPEYLGRILVMLVKEEAGCNGKECRNEYLVACEMLIAKGASVNTSFRGSTALEFAVLQGLVPVVQLLLENKVSISSDTEVPSYYGSTIFKACGSSANFCTTTQEVLGLLLRHLLKTDSLQYVKQKDILIEDVICHLDSPIPRGTRYAIVSHKDHCDNITKTLTDAFLLYGFLPENFYVLLDSVGNSAFVKESLLRYIRFVTPV